MADAQKEGASAESSTKRKEATDRVWAFRLFQNPGMAQNICCIECGHPPKECFVDASNQLYCKPCSQPLIQNGAKINPQAFADNLVSNAEIVCPNILLDPSKNQDELKEAPKQCEEKCLIKDWAKHNDTTCQYTKVDCPTCHSDFSASRCLQDDHNKICGHVIIECEQKCPLKILRKDQTSHIQNDCAETILNCTNDECPDKIARKGFQQHVDQTCVNRIVDCEYKQYGCPQQKVKDKEMDGHKKEFEIKHLQFHLKALYQLVQQQQQQLHNVSEQSGMIQMFGGRDIPNGWIVCDGLNGSPDLRKMFMLKNDTRGNINDDFDVGQISECEMEDEDEDDSHNSLPSYSMVYIMKI